MKTTEIQPLTHNNLTSNQESFNLPNPPSEFQTNQQGTYEQINQLFNEQDQKENTVLEAREILGESAKDLTDEQVYELVTEMQFLVDSWLEEYERKVFDGKSLNELLNLEL